MDAKTLTLTTKAFPFLQYLCMYRCIILICSSRSTHHHLPASQVRISGEFFRGARKNLINS